MSTERQRDIGALIACAAVVWAFARVDRWAGALLVPYALWVGFAILLNGAIVALNGAAP